MVENMDIETANETLRHGVVSLQLEVAMSMPLTGSMNAEAAAVTAIGLLEASETLEEGTTDMEAELEDNI